MSIKNTLGSFLLLLRLIYFQILKLLRLAFSEKVLSANKQVTEIGFLINSIIYANHNGFVIYPIARKSAIYDPAIRVFQLGILEILIPDFLRIAPLSITLPFNNLIPCYSLNRS
jgi:hypothetical protein